MGKIIVTEFISMDGVIEDPGGSENFKYGGWTFKFNRGEDGNKFKMEELENSEASLLGRVTYEGFAEAWPSREGGFADILNKMPKYVLSHNPNFKAEWNNSHVLSGDISEEISKLKREIKGNILVSGSGQAVNFLLENNLVDQINLMVFPVVLGSGKKLFGEISHPINFKLLKSFNVGSDGVTVLIYEKGEEKVK